MVNKFKAIKRERARLRNVQNPQQVDYRRMRKARKIRTAYWRHKKKAVAAEVSIIEEKTAPKSKKPAKEPELEEIDEELEEIYSIDEDELEDFDDE
ncbi:MAG: hypothetical protein GF411_08945 [Candidatus Lokiarchaeota archaeon]|nr:hypothetical protein [Candidatus Lokiarchaeota archaeon]